VGKHRSRVEDVVWKYVIDWLKTEKGKVAAVGMLDNNSTNFCNSSLTHPANGWFCK
jgi:hypothetical protein